MIPVPAFFSDYQARVDAELRTLVPSEGEPVQRSMAYTLHAPSKRVRPVLTMLSAELCGETPAKALAAAAATEPSIGSGSLRALVEQLASDQNDATAVALPLLLLCVFAMALSAMASVLSATVCTIRYDILGEFGAGLGTPAPARQRLVLGSSLVLALLMALFILDAWSISFTGNALLGLAVAICCAQLSFVPLVLGPLVFQSQGGSATVSAPWALAVLCVGAGSAVSGATLHLMTGSEAWLWIAAPASLGSSLIVFFLGRIYARAS